ncbi:MAG: class II aldolase [Actinomycetia bacterium]|nr:class II aldolase [Actinomycetes bacterium]
MTTDPANLVIETALAMNERGINSGMSGNVSMRDGDEILITPSSTPYDELTPADVVHMAQSGAWTADNNRHPSSEWRFHLDIYAARPDVGGIVHAHPVNTTALAVHGRGIGAFHYMVAVGGGRDIRCAPYATFGTAELSAHVVEALVDRTATLMAHHGLVAVGADPTRALGTAIEIETLAAQYLRALVLGEPPELTDEQMDEVLSKMGEGPGYGSTA